MARRANQRQRGIYTDQDTGIVLARDREHPYAHVFSSVPMHSPDYPEANLPPLRLDPEMQQVLAIHVFDNLGCSTPTRESAKYRLVKSAATEHVPMQFRNHLWLPWSVGDEFVDARNVEVVTSEDLANTPIEDMTDAQLAALQEQTTAQVNARRLRKQLDEPIEADEPDFVRFTRERMNQVEDRLTAEGKAARQQEAGE